MPLIKNNKLESKLPLLCATYNIAFENADPKTLCDCL
jgi:hypothetical protein